MDLKQCGNCAKARAISNQRNREAQQDDNEEFFEGHGRKAGEYENC